MKFCISVGLLKVKVGLVCRVMKTLFELMLVVPTWARAADAVDWLLSLVVLGVVGAGVGVGVAVDLQTDGCPEQAYPVCIWQLEHPAEGVLPLSQVSLPTINPSPQVGLQTPCELAEYPVAAQVRH